MTPTIPVVVHLPGTVASWAGRAVAAVGDDLSVLRQAA